MREIRDNCGVYGIYSHEPCVTDIFNALDFLQHRGQQFCGMAVYDEGVKQVTHHGRVIYAFTEGDFKYLSRGRWGIGHVSLWERQPMSWSSRMGEIALAFSGNIINAEQIIMEMKARGDAFYRNYHTEIIGKIIMGCADVVSGIKRLAETVEGAYSIVILTGEGIYVTRDVYGFRPLVLGMGNGKFAASSESRTFQNMDMELVRDIKPGELVLVDSEGVHTLLELPSPRRAFCAFEWAYTASIDSVIEGLYVQEARHRLGVSLAERDLAEQDMEADFVAPVPMSGIGHALGYHARSRLPYQEVFLYNRYADRSYTQASQAAREKMAKRKLSVLKFAVMGKRVVVCDDSIVRGTQIQDKVRELKKAGAKEVHIRVACPPLLYPCDYGVSTRTAEELIARQFFPEGTIRDLEEQRRLEKWVAKQTGADSVKYNSIDAFVASLNMDRTSLCLKCWDGIRPDANRDNTKR